MIKLTLRQSRRCLNASEIHKCLGFSLRMLEAIQGECVIVRRPGMRHQGIFTSIGYLTLLVEVLGFNDTHTTPSSLSSMVWSTTPTLLIVIQSSSDKIHDRRIRIERGVCPNMVS